MLDTLIRQVQNSGHLTRAQVRTCVEALTDEGLPAELKADFLCHLALKGETVEEIAWFAEDMRERAVPVPIEPEWRRTHEVLDVCGTGGDRLNTFNISTTVALICAAVGVPVAKHGNRAITSRCGSADVLEALGIRIDLPPAEAAHALQERHFAFFFAPACHPAFKHIAAARKLCSARGQRTIFNYLGPLLNPARPTAQLVGVPRPDLCLPLARVLQALGVRRGMVVSGNVKTPNSKPQTPRGVVEGSETEVYLDELSTLGQNSIAEFYQSEGCLLSSLDAAQFGLQKATLADLAGGDREANAEIVRRLISGEERGPKRDAVLLNAAAALCLADRASSLLDAWKIAADGIDSGHAERKLKDLAS